MDCRAGKPARNDGTRALKRDGLKGASIDTRCAFDTGIHIVDHGDAAVHLDEFEWTRVHAALTTGTNSTVNID
jgi:hypothetical protein